MPRIALALLAILALSPAPAAAQASQRIYDAQGRLVGTADSARGVTRYRDAQGRLVGQSRTNAPGRAAPAALPRQGR